MSNEESVGFVEVADVGCVGVREGERGEVIGEAIDLLEAGDVGGVVKESGERVQHGREGIYGSDSLLHERRDPILDLSEKSMSRGAMREEATRLQEVAVREKLPPYKSLSKHLWVEENQRCLTERKLAVSRLTRRLEGVATLPRKDPDAPWHAPKRPT